MKILLSVEHPAWAHQFRYLVKELGRLGHDVKVVAINKDRDLDLLEKFGIPYELIANSTGRNVVEKFFILWLTTWRIFRIGRKFQPDLLLGRSSPMMAMNAFLLRRPHLVFEDTECCTTCLWACRLFSTLFVTPESFQTDCGKKHRRVKAFKELFYLHPRYFTPDSSVLVSLGLTPGERYFVLRFTAFQASHDFGQAGLSKHQKIELVRLLSRYGRVIISSETKLPRELEAFQYRGHHEKIHSLLYFAALVVSEGPTMASESAILGTHAVYVATLNAGTLEEQQQKYELLYGFKGKGRFDEAMQKIEQLVKMPNLGELGKQKRQRLVNDTCDINQLFLRLIESRLDESSVDFGARGVVNENRAKLPVKDEVASRSHG